MGVPEPGAPIPELGLWMEDEASEEEDEPNDGGSDLETSDRSLDRKRRLGLNFRYLGFILTSFMVGEEDRRDAEGKRDGRD